MIPIIPTYAGVPGFPPPVGGGHNRFENTVLLVATVGIIQRQYLQAYVRRR